MFFFFHDKHQGHKRKRTTMVTCPSLYAESLSNLLCWDEQNSVVQPDRKHWGWIYWLLGRKTTHKFCMESLVQCWQKNIRVFLHPCFSRPLRHKVNMKFKSLSDMLSMCAVLCVDILGKCSCSNKATGVCYLSDCTAVHICFSLLFRCTVNNFKEDRETRRTCRRGTCLQTTSNMQENVFKSKKISLDRTNVPFLTNLDCLGGNWCSSDPGWVQTESVPRATPPIYAAKVWKSERVTVSTAVIVFSKLAFHL